MQPFPCGDPTRRRTVPAAALAALAALSLGACGRDDGVDPDPELPSPPPSELVSEADFGSEWPLIPDDATLGCVGTGGGATLVVESDGITYALDEAAERDFPRITPIWAGDPRDPESRPSLEPLIERAGELCE